MLDPDYPEIEDILDGRPGRSMDSEGAASLRRALVAMVATFEPYEKAVTGGASALALARKYLGRREAGMSRSGYTEDCDGWALIRWRGAVAAAIRGTRGQELLHGLASALDSMPEKRLIADELVDDFGEVCALGALGVACYGVDAVKTVDPEDYEQVARFFGIAEALAREVQYINDECGWGDTPEDRWKRVRRWVDAQLLTGASR